MPKSLRVFARQGCFAWQVQVRELIEVVALFRPALRQVEIVI
jgi:hypothetical protein